MLLMAIDQPGVPVLIYQATKGEFMQDVDNDVIVARVLEGFERLIHRANPREVHAWDGSLQYMYKVLNTPAIPDSSGVAVEYAVPYTSSRIDFLLTGSDADGHDAAVIVELKQWQSIEAVPDQDGVVRTFIGGAVRAHAHPSYQAWSYARMIQDYNEAVREQSIELAPCAYLHNYRVAEGYDPLFDPAYREYLEQAPPFCAGDVSRLRDFICRYVTHGDDGRVLYDIECGRLRPSKSLQDALGGMLKGNPEFVMIDDQKVVFEHAMELARESRSSGKRQVLIVRGGPGTGKSVVAVNLLVELTRDDLVTQYVSKNAAPRNVYSKLLQRGGRSKAYIRNLFRGPGKFHEHTGAAFDAIIVDEAHRLRERSGLYGNEGENQIKEIIAATRLAVFFIDEEQRVTIDDIGTVSDIRSIAAEAGAVVHEAGLSSQFRCNGSEGYLEWLDDVLGIAPAEHRVTSLDFDFRVFDDPNEVAREIERCNAAANKSRLVAGYCWEWPTAGKANPRYHDIRIPEHEFERSWNLSTTDTWAIDDTSVDQVGCIHTSQGLEFDYVGVIIGPDLRFENGGVVTDRTRRARSDASLKGIKRMSIEAPERADRIADEIIRNTYRVLMTRGMRGCYVFCTDPALADYLRSRLPADAKANEYPLGSAPDVPLAAEDRPEEERC